MVLMAILGVIIIKRTVYLFHYSLTEIYYFNLIKTYLLNHIWAGISLYWAKPRKVRNDKVKKITKWTRSIQAHAIIKRFKERIYVITVILLGKLTNLK